jgi:23S rRNA (uridine2552-2'-O)-methyltransferase
VTGTTAKPPRRETVRLKNARKHSPASQRWLARQLNDPYVQAAKTQGWRSRAAFKLLELDGKYKLIGKHARVVDLGAAPGGWSQVALANGAAKLVGIDLLPIIPVAGAEFIEGDFTEPGMEARLQALLGGTADLVLSDMAPNTTGHVATDHIRISPPLFSPQEALSLRNFSRAAPSTPC